MISRASSLTRARGVLAALLAVGLLFVLVIRPSTAEGSSSQHSSRVGASSSLITAVASDARSVAMAGESHEAGSRLSILDAAASRDGVALPSFSGSTEAERGHAWSGGDAASGPTGRSPPTLG